MAMWRVSANRNLPIRSDMSWDGAAATASVFSWAGFDGDKPDPSKARQAFLVYDADNPNLKGSYKLPFAMVSNGRLVASEAGLRAAASRLPQTNIPMDIMNRARSVIDGYQSKMKKSSMNSEDSKNDISNIPNSVMRYDSIMNLEKMPMPMPMSPTEYPMNPEDHPDDENDPEDKYPENNGGMKIVPIDMLRTGKFMRKSMLGEYVLTIDEQMMDVMIDNFKNNVTCSKVPLDTNHMKQESYGWLTDLRKEPMMVKGKPQTCLVGEWAINSKGQEIMSDQVYKYFSIEFMYNYSQREIFETTKGEDGMEMPKGEMINYGPTITGGALTNRPFIPDLKEVPMMFSDQDIITNGCLVEMSDDLPIASGVLQKTVVNFEENGVELINKPKKQFDISGFSKHKEKDSMKFSANSSLLKFMEEKLSLIEDKNSSEFKDLSDSIATAKSEFAAAQAEFEAKENAVKELINANKKMNDKFSDLTTKVVSLESKIQSSESELMLQRERARQSEINEYCLNMANKGLSKPFVDQIKTILLADKDNKEVVCLSDDQGTKTSLTVRDVIKKIVDALPEDARISKSPSLEFDVGSLNPDAKNETEQFSDKFADAIAAGTKKGLSHFAPKKTKTRAAAIDDSNDSN